MDFLQVLVSGLMIGGIYTMLASGITLVFGVLKVVNFAHGELVMLGMYLVLFLNFGLGLHPYLSLVIAAVLTFGLGLLIHVGLVKWTLSGGHTRQMVLTLGLALVLQGGALAAFGGNYQSPNITPMFGGSISVLGINISTTRLFAFLIAIAVMIALLLFLDKTRQGRAIRAVAMDGYAATLMGIPVKKVFMYTFGLGAALAGIAAAILLPIYPVFPTIGLQLLPIAFVVVVLGGLGSVVGAIYGGLIIGVVEALAGFYLGAAVSQIVVLGLFLAVLLVRPQGIMKAEAA